MHDNCNRNCRIFWNRNSRFSEATQLITIIHQEFTAIDLENIPEYDQKPYIEINNNIPSFTEDEHTTKAILKHIVS